MSGVWIYNLKRNHKTNLHHYFELTAEMRALQNAVWPLQRCSSLVRGKTWDEQWHFLPSKVSRKQSLSVQNIKPNNWTKIWSWMEKTELRHAPKSVTQPSKGVSLLFNRRQVSLTWERECLQPQWRTFIILFPISEQNEMCCDQWIDFYSRFDDIVLPQHDLCGWLGIECNKHGRKKKRKKGKSNCSEQSKKTTNRVINCGITVFRVWRS